MKETISALSKEYIRVRVDAEKSGVIYDPTGDAVTFAFTTSNNLVGATWYGGTWETVGTEYFARCIVGPAGTVTLVAGNTYIVWVKITDSPEIPIKNAGTLQVI
jgi:hypothetical protein